LTLATDALWTGPIGAAGEIRPAGRSLGTRGTRTGSS
jgi:hypothetical protein